MSLLTLLAEFPNYSARKVRRLAKQIAIVQRVSEDFAMGEETGLLKGIEADLMEYNLQQARAESQLNDDVAIHMTPAEQLKELPPTESEQAVSERINVTPTDAAKKAVNELASWVRISTDANLKKDEMERILQRCFGYIHGQSFYTDRTFIQAKLSPQEALPLENRNEEDHDRLARGSAD